MTRGWFAVALAAVPAMLEAGGLEFAKYAGEFTAIGVGGRPLGLGGAYAAVASDVTAAYYNPAGLARLDYPQFMLMHDERFGSLVNYDYAAAAFPVGPAGTVAVTLSRLGVDDIPDTRNAALDINGQPTTDPEQFSRIDPARVTYFNTADWVLTGSYAKRHSEDLSYGASVKLIRRDLGTNAATGVGFDVGLQWYMTHELTLAVSAQDITTTLLAWDTGRNELVAPTVKLGAAYGVLALGGMFMPVADFDVRFENRRSASTFNVGPVSVDAHAGLEYEFRQLVAVRVGYNDVKQLTLGAGLRLPKLAVDYSFAKFDNANDLGNTHRISVMFTLESDRYRRTSD